MRLKVKYISERETLAFEKGKVYEVMNQKHGWYEIMTELGESYWFPPELFEVVKT